MTRKRKPIRIGLVGAGDNTRRKHIPGLLAQEGVELVAVANRRRESSERVARDYGIARVCDDWREVVDADDLDAIVIGTWPYLHCPVTLAALATGKHVLTEALEEELKGALGDFNARFAAELGVAASG